MAQLKDDCFAFSGPLMPMDAALRLLAERIDPIEDRETVAVQESLGRILAEDIAAPRAVPPHDNSAVDGYAVYFDDLDPKNETRLPVTGRVAAGHPLGRPARRGEAVRIFTGAPMPFGPSGTQADGPDTVFMEEDAAAEEEAVRLPSGLKRGANRRRRGEDVAEGAVILRAGTRLRPQEMGLAASIGRAKMSVYRRLRTAVFSTGDEVRDPSADASEGCIFDANRFAVMGMLQGLGCRVTDLGILPDRQEAIVAALAKAAPDHDVLITSGGVSAGEEDHVKAAVQSLGAIHLWRLAIKPGRPIAFGTVKGAAFVGLPGNPVAAMVTFLLLARPMILRLAGASDAVAPRFKVRAEFDYKKKSGRREWVRARLSRGEDGEPIAQKFRSSGAGILTSMTESDGLVELPEALERLSPGTSVDFLPFAEIMQ